MKPGIHPMVFLDVSSNGWLGYLAALGTLVSLDALWLGWLARGFYLRELGELAAPRWRKAPAAAFYLTYPAGLMLLAFTPGPVTPAQAVLRSALVGLMGYGVYDLTNMSTLRRWRARLAFTDMAWGTLLSGLCGAAACGAMTLWP